MRGRVFRFMAKFMDWLMKWRKPQRKPPINSTAPSGTTVEVVDEAPFVTIKDGWVVTETVSVAVAVPVIKAEPVPEKHPGIFVKDSFRPTNPPITNGTDNRSAENYLKVIDQFEVGTNPRYTPGHQGGSETYCNIFLWDVTKAMGAEVPHWIDGNGEPTGVGRGKELNANAIFDWLASNEGPDHGWNVCTEVEACARAATGHPTIVVWKNPKGIGHVAVVIPGISVVLPFIAQAGRINFGSGLVTKGFGDRTLTYYTHD